MELTVDGLTTYLYTGTRVLMPDRPTWLFVHGAAMDHSVWVLQSRYFAYHGCNVLAVDLPGHGRSAGTPCTSIAASAAWLARLLAAIERDTVVVVGHSMGALIALELAACYPTRVAGLALLGIGLPMTVAAPLLGAAQANDPMAIDMIVGWGHSPRSQLGGNLLPGLWLTNESRRLLERAAPGVLYTDLKACHDYRDGLTSAARIRCPVQVVSGQHDLMTPPRATRAVTGALSNCASVVIPDCGHMLMIEQPDVTLDALIGLRQRLNDT